MCATCEMWGLNGDDGTTDFTKELANWFDDNTKTYYRACQDGYTQKHVKCSLSSLIMKNTKLN